MTQGSSVFDRPLAQLSWRDPFRWLALGARDLLAHPGIALFYGGCFMVMGWATLEVYAYAPAYTLALAAGFLLVGPILCTGLYMVSLRRERGEPVSFGESMLAFTPRFGAFALFGGALLIVEMIWARAALVVFAVSFDGVPDFQGSIRALLDPENLGFIFAYLAVGAPFAALIFAVSVIAVPMLIDDRAEVDAITAALLSLRLCITQPAVMLLWGALIAGLVGLALLPWFLGIVVVGPWVGHASWHAYRGAVGVGSVDEKLQADDDQTGLAA